MTYPSCGSCEGHAIATSPDGGFIIAGVAHQGGSSNLLAIRTDAVGNGQWQVSGSGGSCEGTAVALPGVDRVAVAGGGCAAGSGAATLTILDEEKGTVLQSSEYDAGLHAVASALVSTTDGGFLLLADTDATAAGRSDRELLIHRIGADGRVLWSRAISQPFNDTGASALQMNDGGFLIAATHGTGDIGGDDIIVVRLDPSGNDRWISPIGRNDDERAAGIVENGEQGYLVAGTACSRGRIPDCDFYAAGIDPDGNVLWDNRYGGSGREHAAALLPAHSGGFLIAGSTDSPDLGADGRDIRLVQIDGSGTELWNTTFGSPAYEYVTGAVNAPDQPLVLTGYTTDPVGGGSRTLFIASAGTDGREPPAGLLADRYPAGSGGSIKVIVRDATTGAGIPEAQVYIDGKFTGRTSAQEGTLSVGNPEGKRHSFRVAKDGYREATIFHEGQQDLTVMLRPSPIRKLSGAGPPETSLDIVFVPSNTSYDCKNKELVPANRYHGSPDAFLDDIRRLLANRLLSLEKYSTVPAEVPADYRGRLNIYYYWDGFSYADAFAGCAGTLPAGFYDEAPFTDTAIILYPDPGSGGGTCETVGCTSGPGPGPGVWFKTPAGQGMVFLHESGHAMFGLMDTYYGITYYAENQPSPNIWASNASCRDDASQSGWNANLCRPIAGEQTGTLTGYGASFWKYDPDPDLMGMTGMNARFGDAATRRIRYVLNTIRGGQS